MAYHDFLVPVLSFVVAITTPLLIFTLKERNSFQRMVERKLDDLCNRMTKVEIKGSIYHPGPPSDLDKS